MALGELLKVLADLAQSLTWTRVFVYSVVFLFVSFVYDYARQPNYPKQIPMLGHGRGLWATVRNSFAYFTSHQSWIREGYEKYGKRGLPFIAPAPVSRTPDVILPRSQVAWMMDQSSRVLSPHQAHAEILYSEYNFLGRRMTDPFANRAIRKYLARHVSGIVPALQEEVKVAIDQALGRDTEEWKSVNLWDMWMEIVPKTTNRLLVGYPICRDETFLKGMTQFTDDVIRNCFLLSVFPKILHPIVGRLLAISNWWHWKAASEVVLPLIHQRLLCMVRNEAGNEDYKDYEPPEDFITWEIRLAQAEKNAFELDPVVISKRLLPIEFASIHTTVVTGQSWMLDLLSSPPEEGILDILRDEVHARMPADGHWTKASLSSLFRLDSSIRESQRLSNFSSTLVERMVVSPDGLHNPEYGWTLPKGSFVTVNLQETHHDEDIYENANSYVPLRFSRIREAWESKSEEERKQNDQEGVEARGLGMVTTSDKHFPFGHGRHACPGRSFVACELKLIMAYLLLNYDFKMLLHERPHPQWIGSTRVPPLKACIEVKRKTGTT